MKKSIFTLGVSILMAGVIFTGCDNVAQKEADAKEDVQEAKQDLKEVQQDAQADANKVASAEEWKSFQNDTEARIKINEGRIAELKMKMKKPGTVLDPLYARKIEELEQRNRALRARLVAYENSQSDWESFKREFNHDMDELGASISDIGIDNKK